MALLFSFTLVHGSYLPFPCSKWRRYCFRAKQTTKRDPLYAASLEVMCFQTISFQAKKYQKYPYLYKYERSYAQSR